MSKMVELKWWQKFLCHFIPIKPPVGWSNLPEINTKIPMPQVKPPKKPKKAREAVALAVEIAETVFVMVKELPLDQKLQVLTAARELIQIGIDCQGMEEVEK